MGFAIQAIGDIVVGEQFVFVLLIAKDGQRGVVD
jgi:hypothetical protein